jgi:hypothetical protein
MTVPRNERFRRLLVGDLRRLFRHRYGPTLPADDAGRDDLDLLLNPISLDPKMPAEKMGMEIELIAPWMSAAEAKELIDQKLNVPVSCRRLGPWTMGNRVMLTNAEREALKVWQIAPVDIDDFSLAEQRKEKRRARERSRRRRAGAKSRAVYEAQSKSKLKPWEAEGISRAKWYRRRATGPCPAILIKEATDLSQPPAEAEGETEAEGAAPKAPALTPKRGKPSSIGHELVSQNTSDRPVPKPELHPAAFKNAALDAPSAPASRARWPEFPMSGEGGLIP